MATCREFSAFPKKGKAGKILVILKTAVWELNTNETDLLICRWTHLEDKQIRGIFTLFLKPEIRYSTKRPQKTVYSCKLRKKSLADVDGYWSIFPFSQKGYFYCSSTAKDFDEFSLLINILQFSLRIIVLFCPYKLVIQSIWKDKSIHATRVTPQHIICGTCLINQEDSLVLCIFHETILTSKWLIGRYRVSID